MRAFADFTRDMSVFVFSSSGEQLWPDPELIQGVPSELITSGEAHSYVTTEAELGQFPGVTRVQAARLRPNKLAPASGLMTDVELSESAAAQFRAAGSACRVVFLKAP
ncbi:hypothetical protein ACFP81_05090 [Deinococcus lacus]|uniref:Uncharacterized protein n=1 Tax=Deinococcus lacus TaxID=392561 RepID=A0ABW1YB64_9DEIO